jgi:hypothetical protein
MPQLDLFSALQSSTEVIDTEFKSACVGAKLNRRPYEI